VRGAGSNNSCHFEGGRVDFFFNFVRARHCCGPAGFPEPNDTSITSAEIEVPHGKTCEEEKAKHTESANGLLPREHADIVKDVQELIPDAEGLARHAERAT